MMRPRTTTIGRPRGLMDMASDFESGSCGFESHRGQNFFQLIYVSERINNNKRQL